MIQKIETHNTSSHHPELACPRCSKHSVVQYGSMYRCLNCGFKRDVTDDHSGGVGILAILGAGFVLLLFAL